MLEFHPGLAKNHQATTGSYASLVPKVWQFQLCVLFEVSALAALFISIRSTVFAQQALHTHTQYRDDVTLCQNSGGFRLRVLANYFVHYSIF